MEEKQIISANLSKADVEKNLATCIYFLESLGIKIINRKLAADTFLPGLSIEQGCIVIDKDTLKFPGDILHEAAHIAIVPAADRDTLNEAAIGERSDREAEENLGMVLPDNVM